MIAVVTPDDEWNQGFPVSTKVYHHEARIACSRRRTMVLQSRTLCADASPLASKLHALPCRRNVYTWKEYLEALLPISALALDLRTS